MGEIKALTSLRGIAAMMVVMQHFSATAQLQATGDIPSLMPHGYMAVSLFFVLSGFIMAYTYGADFVSRGMLAMPSFLMKRVGRILPLNTAVVIAILTAGSLSQTIIGRNIFYASTNIGYDLVCNLLLLQGFGIGTNLNGPSWSISTEFAAYLLFPALLVLAFARRPAIVIAVAAASAGALLAMALRHPWLGLNAESVGDEITLCFTQFVLGLITFRVTRMASMRRYLQSDGAALLAAGWVAVALCLRLDLLAAIAFPAVVATLACNSGRIADLLSARVPYFLGEISFSIYLLHDPCRPLALALLRALHPGLLSTLPALGFALVGSIAVLPLAWLGYVAIERPGRHAIRRLVAMAAQPAILTRG